MSALLFGVVGFLFLLVFCGAFAAMCGLCSASPDAMPVGYGICAALVAILAVALLSVDIGRDLVPWMMNR